MTYLEDTRRKLCSNEMYHNPFVFDKSIKPKEPKK